MNLKIYKWFINSWFFYSILFIMTYTNKNKLNIEYNLNDKQVEIVSYLLIILIIFLFIKWFNKWIYQYNIRAFWKITLGEVKEEKYTATKYYKYKITFIDDNFNKVTFQEKHAPLFLNERWKSNIFWNNPLWSKENPYPKIKIMYDKSNSQNAIIF
jgi:hypothetical protein